MVSSNARLSEKLEALEDEVELIKTEIRQTLIDMREAMLQRSDIFSMPRKIVEVSSETSVVGSVPDPSPAMSVPQSSVASPVPVAPNPTRIGAVGLDLSIDQVNKTIVNEVLEWMGSAKEKGITAARLFPILEAYESSGMMSPLMSKFIMKNMSMLDEIELGGNGKSISPADFSSTLSDLHKLVCISIDSS